MAAKKAGKKAAKKAGALRAGKPRKDFTISLRVDAEMREYLDAKTGGEAYGPEIRRLIREEKERERLRKEGQQ